MMPKAVVCALVVLCSALSVNSSPAGVYVQSKAEQSLMKYMMKPRAASINAANSMECFNYYIPLLNEVATTYQNDYEACISTANAAIEELVDEGTEVRKNITNISTEVCEVFNTCQSESENLGFFDCYTNLGDQTVRQVYGISQDASVAAAEYRTQYRVIQDNSDKCCNETQRVYVTETANAYDELDDCLVNGLKTTPSPTTTVEDTTTTEAVTTTESPVTTTEEPVTTTEPPVTTTEEPVTSTTEGTTTTPEETTSTTEGVTSTTEGTTATPEETTSTTEGVTSTTEGTTTTPEETTSTTVGVTSTTEDVTSTTEGVTSTTEASTTEAETQTPERDPVEELTLTEKTARNRLEAFVRNWSKRFA